MLLHGLSACAGKTELLWSAGTPLNFVLLSWLYALYSFDYRWTLQATKLEHRVGLFETHWAFFGGALCAP